MLDKKNKIDFDPLYLYATLAFSFLLPLVKGVVSLFATILSVIWIVEGDYKRKLFAIISNKLFLSFLAFLAFSLLSILWTSNLKTGLNVLEKNLFWIIIFVLGTSLNKEFIRPIVTAFLAGMFVSAMIAYGVFFEFWTFKEATPQNPTPIMNHIDYGVYLAFASLVLMNRVFSTQYPNKEKIIFAILFLIFVGNLFLIYGRTGQVALAVGIVVMCIIHFRLSFKAIALSALSICVIFTLAYNLSNSFKERANTAYNNIQSISNLDFDSSLGIRAGYWITTYNIVKENPIIGVGLGDYIDDTKKEIESNTYQYFNDNVKQFLSEHHPHSQYLLVALQLGLIGLLLLVHLFYRILKQDIDDPEIKELSLLFISIFLIASLVEPLLLKRFPLSLFVLFIGLFSRYSTHESRFKLPWR